MKRFLGATVIASASAFFFSPSYASTVITYSVSAEFEDASLGETAFGEPGSLSGTFDFDPVSFAVSNGNLITTGLDFYGQADCGGTPVTCENAGPLVYAFPGGNYTAGSFSGNLSDAAPIFFTFSSTSTPFPQDNPDNVPVALTLQLGFVYTPDSIVSLNPGVFEGEQELWAENQSGYPVYARTSRDLKAGSVSASCTPEPACGALTTLPPWNGAGAVPEPSTWAMFLMGFGLIGAAMRLARRPPGLAATSLAETDGASRR